MNPHIKTGLIVSQKSENPSLWESQDYDVVSAAYPLVTDEFLKEAALHDKEVYAWTVNDKPVMKRMLALGVTSIITDAPDQLIHLMNVHN